MAELVWYNEHIPQPIKKFYRRYKCPKCKRTLRKTQIGSNHLGYVKHGYAPFSTVSVDYLWKFTKPVINLKCPCGYTCTIETVHGMEEEEVAAEFSFDEPGFPELRKKLKASNPFPIEGNLPVDGKELCKVEAEAKREAESALRCKQVLETLGRRK